MNRWHFFHPTKHCYDSLFSFRLQQTLQLQLVTTHNARIRAALEDLLCFSTVFILLIFCSLEALFLSVHLISYPSVCCFCQVFIMFFICIPKARLWWINSFVIFTTGSGSNCIQSCSSYCNERSHPSPLFPVPTSLHTLPSRTHQWTHGRHTTALSVR